MKPEETPRMAPNLENGHIPSGDSCFASDICGYSNDCLVSHGKTINKPFSCGAARLFALSQTTEDAQKRGEYD